MSPSRGSGCPPGARSRRPPGSGPPRAGGRGRRRADEPSAGRARRAIRRRPRHMRPVRSPRRSRWPGSRGGRQRSVGGRPGRPRRTAPASARGSSPASKGAPVGDLDPVVRPDSDQATVDLAALDADLEDRREGPDRHRQGQDQQRQVAGRGMAAECPQAEDRDEVAPASATQPRPRTGIGNSRMVEQADGEADEHRVAARNGSNPRLSPLAVCRRQPTLAQEPGRGQRDADRQRLEDEPPRPDPKDRAGRRARGRGAPGRRDRPRRERPGARSPRARRGSRRSTTGHSGAHHDQRANAKADQRGRDRDQQPSHSCAASSWPPTPRGRAPGPAPVAGAGRRGCRSARRPGGHRQRPERGDRQGRLGRRPLVEIALDEAEQPRADERLARVGPSRS